MSLIEEALRRIQDPTLSKSQQTGQPAAPAKTAKTAPAGTTATAEPAAHSWQASAGGATPAAGMNLLTIVGLSVLSVGVFVVAGSLIWISRSFSNYSGSNVPAQIASRPAQAQARDNFELTPPPPALPEPMLLTNESLEVPPAKETVPAFTMPWVKIQPKPKTEAFVLSGVVEGGGEPYAMINDSIVAVGGSVGGATLASITDGAVTLRQANGSEVVLRIEQP